MTNWISLDLDWCTGDCREDNQYLCCSRQCPGCISGVVGRAHGKGYFDARERFARVVDMLKGQTILPRIIVRDCHGDIFKCLVRGDTVYNIDFHTDDYDYDHERNQLLPIHCGNWVNYCWRDGIDVIQAEPEDVSLGEYRLFIALSVPYTNDSLDADLFCYLKTCGVPVNINVPKVVQCADIVV